MTITTNPFSLFSQWFDAECRLSKVRIPTAVCLSTLGTDGFPNARFVSFKEIIDDAFVITGTLKSRKGIEIQQHNKVALTFWWTETERQVRIQGVAEKISEQQADAYFQERSLEAKAVSSICEQGNDLKDVESMEQKVRDVISENTHIERPTHWGGLTIQPLRIEFMEFKETRLHDRKLYENTQGAWQMRRIQA